MVKRIKSQNIPLWSTRDLWENYRNTGQSDERFSKASEHFLIARLEECRPMVQLPTRPHRRSVHEVVFVSKGSLQRTCNLHRIELGAGGMHLMPPGQVSTVQHLSEDIEGFYLHFSLESVIQLYHQDQLIRELDYLYQGAGARGLALPETTLPAVKNLFQRLLDEQNTHCRPGLINAYLVALCVELIHALPQQQSEKIDKARELTERFKDLVQQYFRRHLLISEYAAMLNVSPNHLNKAVRQSYGRPASALPAERLLLEAKVLLRHTPLPVSEVAYQLGFSDPSYFIRFFRKATGMSPLAFRRED